MQREKLTGEKCKEDCMKSVHFYDLQYAVVCISDNYVFDVVPLKMNALI